MIVSRGTNNIINNEKVQHKCKYVELFHIIFPYKLKGLKYH